MDVKNIFEKYPETVGLKSLDLTPIKKSIEIIKKYFSENHQFRITLVPDLVFEEDIHKMEKIINDSITIQPYK